MHRWKGAWAEFDAQEPSADCFLLTFQLPYLIDGKTKLTQSNAILRYIARKHKMCEYLHVLLEPGSFFSARGL